MLDFILLQIEISKSGKMFFVILIFVSLTIFLIKVKLKNFHPLKNHEQRIIETIKSNRIIDPAILEGLSSEDMKLAIRQEILNLNIKYGKTMDLQKMNVLMDELEFENLQKLYQWCFSKKADS